LLPSELQQPEGDVASPRPPRAMARGSRGGVASRMTGSQKRRAKKEREALVGGCLVADMSLDDDDV